MMALANRAGHLRRIGRELLHNTPLLVGLLMLAGFVAIALGELVLLGSSLSTLPTNLVWANAASPPGPSAQHWLGVANWFGVDELTAVLQATPWDLALVGLILGASVATGSLLGTYAGFAAGPADVVVTMVSDVLLSVPPFFLVSVLFLGVSLFLTNPAGYVWALIGLFIVVIWPYYARPVRARAERVSREPYVEAARAAGAPRRRVLWRHVLPNSLFPIFAQVPVDLYNIFFVLTLFPYLGCSGKYGNGNYGWIELLPSVTFPEWGNELGVGVCRGWSFLGGADFWWMYLWPMIAIVLLGLTVMLICDGLERMLHGRIYGG
jgi:peptide/nickel transport system permease protein